MKKSKSNKKLRLWPILLPVGTILLADFLLARLNKRPRVTYKENLPGNYNAQAVPPLGIRIQNEDRENEYLMRHELVHWDQYRRTGAILFYLKYSLQKFFYGYDKMPMELEARIKSGESEECIRNYTQCVRDGRAKTIFDPDFRKDEEEEENI